MLPAWIFLDFLIFVFFCRDAAVTACEEDYGIALQGLVDAGNSAAFDMVVMDMQHALRRDLYDLAVRLVREGGVVAVLWSLADM